MIFRKRALAPNYLDLIPTRSKLAWSTDEAGMVTLYKENTGLFNRVAQKLLGKPPVSQIHLDGQGSFVWPRIDGKRTVGQLAELAREAFGEQAEPAYPRMAKYIQILASYEFITLADAQGKPVRQ